MKFRKRPVVIEAVQLRRDTMDEMVEHAGIDVLTDHAAEFVEVDPLTGQALDGDLGILIHTLEGVHLGRLGDWIIRGVKGELYPCKPDIFDATYEAVE